MGEEEQNPLISEQELFELEDYINTIWGFLPIPVAYISPSGTMLDVTKAFEELLGYPIVEIVGRSLFDFCREEAKMGQVHEFTLSGKRVTNYEVCCITDSGGRDIPVSVSTLMRTDTETGQPIGYFATFIDITKRKQAEEALRESEERYRALSAIDELTGLYNRRHFYEMLETEMHRTQRYGRAFSLAMLDLDGFKEYNDRFGHISGNSVLQSFAQTLKSSLRKPDIAFRYGGDEFTIILPATSADMAKETVDRIGSEWLQVAREQYPGAKTPLGFSAGIAQFPENAETADGLLNLADAALYHSKRQGGYKSTLVSEL
jgi:diguanylate cyclase (GGDEF)-like protein/PAS domain S-box-containing protein